MKLPFLICAAVGFTLNSNAAFAQVECAGSLEQKHFGDNIKALNAEIQTNINEYRKLELSFKQQAEGSPEAAATKKRMDEINVTAATQKKRFKELNSPLFPKTNFAVYGRACSDKRWTIRAREILAEKPEMLGGTYNVWMDATTKEIKVSDTRPDLAAVLR